MLIKTSRSTAEKIIVREKVNSLDEMWDIVRYTSLLKTKDYVKSYKETLKELESKGYKINKIKDTWRDPFESYNGVNVKIISPEGAHFELQFHTKESLKAKEEAHILYEEQRILGKAGEKDPERFDELEKEMKLIFDNTPNPYDYIE